MSQSITSHPEPGIVGRALLISKDPIISHQLSTSMQRFAITAELCTDPVAAAQLVNTRKFDAIIVDVTLNDSAAHVLENVRGSRSNHNAVTFAVVDGSTRQLARRLKAQFVLDRDSSGAVLSNVFRAALGLIIRERRRYYRCPLDLPAKIALEGESEARCKIINISEGGAAIQANVNFKPDSQVRIAFNLGSFFTIGSEICWCDNNRRSGLRFHSWPAEQRPNLQEWLARQLEQTLPERVAKLFTRSE